MTDGDDVVVQSGLKAGESSRGGRGGRRARRERRRRASGSAESRVMSPSRIFILRPVATSLLMAAHAARRARSRTGSCRSPRCRRSTTRRSRSSRSTRARARRDGLVGDRAARAPVRADAGPEADDVDAARSAARSSRCSSTSTLDIDVAEQEVQAAINARLDVPARRPARIRRSTARSNPADTPMLTLALTSDDAAAVRGPGPRGHAARARRSRSCRASAW